MKTNKKALTSQRKILSRRIESWMKVSDSYAPPSGWLRAIRGALGISTRQLAQLIGTNHSGITALEKREVSGKASLEMLQKAAKAMDCRLVYAIIPNEANHSLDEILDRHALLVAKRILGRLEHSMRLEQQGSSKQETDEQIKQLATDLKEKMDSRIWDTSTPKKKKAPR